MRRQNARWSMGIGDANSLSAQRRFADADRQDPVTDRKQGRAASDQVPVDDRCDSLGGDVKCLRSSGGRLRSPARLRPRV